MANIRKILYALLLSFSLGLNAYGDMKNLAFYVADYSKEPPVVDGRLDDKCWKQADECTTYYAYNQPNPEPGTLKTRLQMSWNEQGLFLAIVNYDANMAGIRGKYTARDAPELWQDDCAELYFDPYADAIGYTKFVVNALGTLGDMRRVDAAVVLNEWNASGVQVATQKNADSWNIEMFIPWSDLGLAAVDGSLWRFCHVRYAWSSGKFTGVTSAPGGSYTTPGNFGYLYFAGKVKPDRSIIAKVLSKKAAPPWSLSIDNGLLICENGQPVFEELSGLISKEQKKMKINFEKLSKHIKDVKNPELNRKFNTAKSRTVSAHATTATLQGLKSLQTLNAELSELNSMVELEQLSNSLN